MPNAVYSGKGSYDPDTLEALYDIYLPSLNKGTFNFHTNSIYNFSSTAYPNTILIFMDVADGPNSDFSGSTTEPATNLSFNLKPSGITDIDSTCIPLITNADINVIFMHDDDLDTTYASANLYNTPLPLPAPGNNDKGENKNKLESVAFMPKRFGSGTLKPLRIKKV